MDQRFIEHDLPLAEISEASAREKNIRHGHPSTLHIWWARRPLAASRATALAALLDDPGPHEPEKRRELKDLIKEIAPWEAVKNGNNEAIERAQEMVQEQYDEPPKVLDPFAGGGSIPLETLRLGAETYASDYNPVAVFIEKATLEWPQKFGVEVELPEEEDDDGLGMGGKKVNLLSYLVEKWANKILEEAREEIGQFYPTETGEGLVGKRDVDSEQEGWTPVGYLWARTIPCQNPTCEATIPLIKQFWLCKKDDKKIAFRPVVDEEKETVEFELLHGEDLKEAKDEGFDPSSKIVQRGSAVCPVCQQVTENEELRHAAKRGGMGQRMIAVVLHHPQEVGKKYRLFENEDVDRIRRVEECLNEKVESWKHAEPPLPNEKIDERRPSPNARGLSGLTRYSLESFEDLFNSRQKLSLITLLDKLLELRSEIQEDANRVGGKHDLPNTFGRAVYSYLAIILSRMTDYSSTLTQWVKSGEFAAHTFVRQALPLSWDYFENNPFSGAGGEWTSHRDWVLRYIRNNSWQSNAKSNRSYEE